MLFAVIIKPKDLLCFLKTLVVLQLLLAFENPNPLESTFRSRAVPSQGRVASKFLILVCKFFVTVEKLLPNLTKEKYYIVSNVFQWYHTWDLRVTMLGPFAPSSHHLVSTTKVFFCNQPPPEFCPIHVSTRKCSSELCMSLDLHILDRTRLGGGSSREGACTINLPAFSFEAPPTGNDHNSFESFGNAI